MSLLLYLIFFVSGAAALIFETLWFRQSGLAFGNSVWASSIVLASFMAGLALGNALAAALGERVQRPIRWYAAIELTIAVTGLGLVHLLPEMTPILRPLLVALDDQPALLNATRLTSAFLLLLIPSTAMGFTLPVLVKALLARDPHFGPVLGRLYGWNNIGAVVGAIAGEGVLLELLGVRGTGMVAAALGVGCAGAAIWLSGRLSEAATPSTPKPTGGPLPSVALRICAAAFLTGGILLAFEVVWFRFLHLFVHGGPLSFALMLGVVLSGIGTGGFVAGAIVRRRPEADRHTASLALVAGVVCVVTYTAFEFVLEPFGTMYVRNPWLILGFSAALALPTAILSGMLFTWMGTSLHRSVGLATRSAGLLTLSNTLGAGLGSLIAGFALLPWLGMERSLHLLAGSYGVVALLTWHGRASTKGVRLPRWVAAAALLAAMIFFPSGLMRSEFIEISIRRNAPRGAGQVVTIREGRSETIILVRADFMGDPVSYVLFTDGFNMAGTNVLGRRYMKFYTWWPVALAPPPRTALLISYGAGSTAKSLVDTASLDHIDVVDISREILELSEVIYPDPADDPLRDPRVEVHVEDGRYFLETTDRRFDLITGEPPPPKFAGVVNLYTREFFQLAYDRLADGGVNTWWLPTLNLTEDDTKAIVAAYCEVFSDCSLWTGAGLTWMLVGSRGGNWHRSEEMFAAQWADPKIAKELKVLGMEIPEQLGATFLADADRLREITRDTQPVTDDWPKRISTSRLTDRQIERPKMYAWMDVKAARDGFANSTFVREAWPAALRERTLAYFDVQRIVNAALQSQRATHGLGEHFADLHMLLTDTSLETVPLWQLGHKSDRLRVLRERQARGASIAGNAPLLASAAVAERDFAEANRLLKSARTLRPRDTGLAYLQIYVLLQMGEKDEAKRAALRLSKRLPAHRAPHDYWDWLDATFGLPSPYADDSVR